MADSIVNVVGLRKRYGTNEVLKGIDLDVKRGEVIAIIGKSGSGKSTLLRCVNGLEVFQEGSLEVDGRRLKHGDARAMRELRQHVGMIFQNFNLFPHLTVGRNVMLAPTLVKKRNGSEAEAQARQLLARVGLAEKFDAWPDQLSGGQQQRVAIARALAMQPSVMLCDEITSALDPELVGEVLNVMRQLAAEGRHPVGSAVDDRGVDAARIAAVDPAIVHQRRPHPAAALKVAAVAVHGLVEALALRNGPRVARVRAGLRERVGPRPARDVRHARR